MFSVPLPGLQSEGEHIDAVVDGAGDAEDKDSGKAEDEAYACAAVAAEGSDRGVALVDEHGLHDKEIVVERDHRVDEGNEH